MKSYTITEITELVRQKYDEIGINDSEMMSDSDSSNMDKIIKSNISAAYRFVVLSADISLLEGKQIQNAELSIDENMIGKVKLPDDFLRGISFRLTSWQSAQSDIISEESTEYRMQSDPYACNTWQNPVAALVHTSEGRFIELYKARTKEDTLRSFIYIPTWDKSTESVNVPEQLAESFIYYVAALTATTFREDVANDFFKVSRSLIGLE